MKNTSLSLDRLPKPAPIRKASAQTTSKKARPAKPIAWGQGVLKKIEEFRLALALEK